MYQKIGEECTLEVTENDACCRIDLIYPVHEQLCESQSRARDF